MAVNNGAVYWIGADGNVWFKSGQPGGVGWTTKNVGKPINVGDQGFDSQFLSAEATRIADPNPPKPGATSAPSNPNGGGGGGGTQYADKSNDIALQLAGLSAVDQQQNSGLSAVDKALGNLTTRYDTETSRNEKNYGDQSTQNNTNLQKNRQTAYVNAAQGRQGLFGTLASLGALNGSGIDLANRAVQKGANDDLSGAADNYSTNQSQLDTAIGTFRDEDKARRREAATSADNARQNVRNEAAKSRLSFLTNLANDYTAQGDTAKARSYTDQAKALYPTLATTSIPNANIAYTGAAFTPGTLADYLAGADSTVVTATPTQPGASTGGLIASTNVRKKDKALV